MSDEMMNYNGVTPYEAFKMSEMSRKGKVNGVVSLCLCCGVDGTIIWVYRHFIRKVI